MSNLRSVTADLEQRLLSLACVPEHIVPMMSALSGGSPLICGDYLMFHKEDWLIFIGYPIEGQCGQRDFSNILNSAATELRVSTVWLICPAIPAELSARCGHIESDRYYRLDCHNFRLPGRLRREISKASQNLTVECNRDFTTEHHQMSTRYALKLTVSPRVKTLYTTMPKYVAACDSARVISARDSAGSLAAFLIVDLSAARFACYLIGGYSTSHYVPHASDLLFHRMVTLSQEHDKEYLHLGLGVHRGIRRFKEKWGGTPFLDYRQAEYKPPGHGIKGFLRSLISSR